MTETENQKSKITLGLITSWTLGSLFLLAGVGGLFQPEARGMGITSLIIACLLLPPVRRFVYQQTGKSLSMGVRVILFFVLLLSGAASTMPQSEFTAANGVDVSQVTSPPTATAQKAEAPKGLIVENFTLQKDEYGTGKIVGTLKNNTGKQYGYVQIEFNLYDSAGNQVGSTLANVNNLEPGRTWKFEAAVLASEATEAQVKNITSF